MPRLPGTLGGVSATERPEPTGGQRVAVPARPSATARYIFKHALVQDAAYQSLLKRTRQQYHQQVAALLEERFPETVEVHPELVAHHFAEAGCTEEGATYYERAGQIALARSANVEAAAHFERGLELLVQLPPTSMTQRRFSTSSANFSFWLLADQMRGRQSRPLSRDERADLARNHPQPKKPT